MLKMAEILDKLDSTISNLYQRRSGIPAASWKESMGEELWLSAAEAQRLGLVDRILPATSASSSGQQSHARSPAASGIINNLLSKARPVRPAARPSVEAELLSYANRVRQLEAEEVQEYRIANRARIAQRPEAGAAKFIKWS